MKDIFNWIITSSADPAKVGLAVRGFLVWAVAQLVDLSTLVCRLGVYCVDLGPLQGLVEPVVGFVVAALTVVSYGMIVFGILRKTWLNRWSAQPKNDPMVDLLGE